MRTTALILALAIAAVPAWAQDKAADNPQPADKPAAEKAEATKAEPEKPEAPLPQARKPSRKHSSKRMEDARHCLDKPSNTEIIKCAEAYL